ncbi:MAG: response regulator transcription factor [Candidatus Marinimicrobia bacterium]|nr:response regulator transcription factor [Candidatus Neomarinimicrobiota bacterium]
MINILIIDDPATENHISQESFLELDLKAHFTSGKQNGLRIARRYRLGLIILNLEKEEDGFELLSLLVKDPQTLCIPIVYISSSLVFENPRRIMNAGADDYLIKPPSTRDLTEAVNCRLNTLENYKEKLMQLCRESLEADDTRPMEEDHVLVTLGARLHLLKYTQIICILALKEYSKLRLDDGRSIVVRKSLKSWVDQLPSNNFLRIHRGSIINVSAIERIQKIKARSYVVYLKTLTEPLEFSQRYANIMRKTFPT